MLVHRFAGLQILAESLQRMSAGQVAGAGAPVIPGAVAHGAAAVHGQTAEHRDVVRDTSQAAPDVRGSFSGSLMTSAVEGMFHASDCTPFGK